MKTALEAINERYTTRESRANNPRDFSAHYPHSSSCLSHAVAVDINNPLGERLFTNPRGNALSLIRRNNPFTQF